MKKLALVLLVAIIAIIAFSACNHSACPAYSDNNTEQAENNG